MRNELHVVWKILARSVRQRTYLAPASASPVRCDRRDHAPRPTTPAYVSLSAA
jgi:hypothetical protein